MDKMLVLAFDNLHKATEDPPFCPQPQETGDRVIGGETPRILLLRNDPTGSSSLVDQLEQFGCECQIASVREGVALLEKRDFHIVVCELNVSEDYTARLISQLTSSNASLFFHLEVEDSCWWLPAVVIGQDCRGTPALRPKNFNPILKELLREIASGVHQYSLQDSAVFAELVPSAFLTRRQHGCVTVASGTLESLSPFAGDRKEY